MHHDVVKPREIREMLRGEVHPSLGKILVRLAEDQIQTRMMVSEIAKTIMNMTAMVNDMTKAVGLMHQHITDKSTLNDRLASLGRTDNVKGEDI